ncbi:fructoselysine 6-kinase [Gallicola sp. Sow4_E12]|uniref:fructoselysine 6-kinase n=1 Tax=Gallicola sp. Sow4_E12 TaxID=3438785 RepID=UPI003F8EE7BF
MYKIACFGDNCVDYYTESDEYFFGGNPLNVAVYCKRLGHESSYIGAVGTDRFGEAMKNQIASKGVDLSHLKQIEGKTAISYVTIENSDRVFGDYEEGVMESFSLTNEDINFILTHDVAVTGLWGHCEEYLEKIKSTGILTAFDSTDRPEDKITKIAIPWVDLFFFSDDESSEEELKKKMREIHSKGPDVVIATRGEKGSLAYNGEIYFHQGIISVEVADTMGAGDSYIAGFLCEYLKEKNIEGSMKSGAESSAVTLKYCGSW